MKTIGICGKIGSGKSSVGVFLAERGISVFDLDREMHLLYATSEVLREKIAERFGAECVGKGTVNRAALAKCVFREPRSLSDLENIVYPLLRSTVESKLFEARRAASEVAAVEGALLFKWPEFSRSLDEIWVVEAPENLRLERLEKRGLSREDALLRMRVQENDPLPPNDRYEHIDNSGPMNALKKRIDELLSPKF